MKEYYTLHSIYSNPSPYQDIFDSLPSDIESICSIIQNQFLHYADLTLFNIKPEETRHSEMNARYTHKILKNILSLDSSPLHFFRNPENRVMGICRDTALLLCSVLRSRNIPARLRSGFVNYFIPGLYLDGYCVEFYDDNLQRWRSVDTRTTQHHIDHYHLKIDFDLTDVPNTKFISAAAAWKMCRFKGADPIRFGSRQHRGLFTIRNRLIQDLALLNKEEVLIWDMWGLMLSSVIIDFDMLDQLAELLDTESNNIDKLSIFYNQHPALKVPDSVLVDSPFLTAEWVSLDKH